MTDNNEPSKLHINILETIDLVSGVNWSDTVQGYDAVVADARNLMIQKNHDYGDSWRLVRLTSLTDKIYVKVLRIKQLEDLAASGKSPLVSEGIESEYRDILNYAAFSLIKMEEQKSKEG
jgi:hypothetical protein